MQQPCGNTGVISVPLELTAHKAIGPNIVRVLKLSSVNTNVTTVMAIALTRLSSVMTDAQRPHSYILMTGEGGGGGSKGFFGV